MIKSPLRKIVALFVTIILVAANLNVAAASSEFPFTTGGQGSLIINSSGTINDIPGTAFATVESRVSGQKVQTYKNCASEKSGKFEHVGFASEFCDTLKFNVSVNQSLGPCVAESNIACIEKFAIENNEGAWVAPESFQEVGTTNSFAEAEKAGSQVAIPQTIDVNSFKSRPELNLGDAFQGVSYRFNNVQYGNSNYVLVQASRRLDLGTDNNQIKGGLKIDISALRQFSNQSECRNKYFMVEGRWQCKVNEVDPTKFKIDLLLPELPKGWSDGRIFGLKINYAASNLDSSQRKWRVQISGSSVTYSKISYYFSALDSKDVQTWRTILPNSTPNGAVFLSSDSPVGVSGKLFEADQNLNRATSQSTDWTFNSGAYAHPGPIGFDKYFLSTHTGVVCTDVPFGAFVTSNALFYSAKPYFDRNSQSLVYQLSSPHLAVDGQSYVGAYELMISKSAANCLWNLSGGSYKAEVSVVQPDGVAKVFTSTLSSDQENIHFQAAGFTFSSDIVSVKFVPNESTDTSSKVKTPVKVDKPEKRTIICNKGQLKKKVTGLNPKCPAGYKVIN